jgi:hypothetical protein
METTCSHKQLWRIIFVAYFSMHNYQRGHHSRRNSDAVAAAA